LFELGNPPFVVGLLLPDALNTFMIGLQLSLATVDSACLLPFHDLTTKSQLSLATVVLAYPLEFIDF
jgi:hypothetical protein